MFMRFARWYRLLGNKWTMVWYCFWCLCAWTRKTYVIFTQASKPRLGKSSRDLALVLLKHLAQAESHDLGDRSSRLGEHVSPKREIAKICVSAWIAARRETFVLGEKWSRPSEKASPKREFVECHCNALTQARKPSSSETVLVTWTKASSLSEENVVLCFKSRRYAWILCLWCGAWRTKSISDLGCAWFESWARSSCWVESMRNVNNLVHRRYSWLGWVSEGVHFILRLENAMSEGVHSRKGGYACPSSSEELRWQASESVM